MWFLLLLVYLAHTIFYVQGEDRLILKDGKHPCEGHIKIYHKGTWGYAGDIHWNKSTEEVVCRSTNCGKPVEGLTEDVLRPINSKIWLNEMVCNGNESHLWDCSPPGWGISFYQKDMVKKLTCSNNIKISLDGFRCAGAVQYSTDGEKPSGYICADNWGTQEADKLCESLKCGKSKEIPKYDLMVWKGFKASKKMVIDCSGIENEIDNLWQCVTQESPTCKKPASVICQAHERLRLSGTTSNVCSGKREKEENGKWQSEDIKTSPELSCKQMHCGTNMTYNNNHLTCSDKVEVQLMDNGKNSKCYGTVHIEVNNLNDPVCASDWTKENGEIVCKELNCGKLISTGTKDKTTSGIMDNVKCSNSDSSLWHCEAKHGTSLSCLTASVVCEKNIRVRLEDGPGKCAGRVEIQHEDGWKRVNKNGWTEKNSNTVCKELKCGSYRKPATDEKFSQGSGGFLPKKVNCLKTESKISSCFTEESANTDRKEEEAVGITCENNMVVFLHGGDSCSGMVGIEHGNNTYWLSGSNETWNQDTANIVCQQKHCGQASNFHFIPNVDKNKNVWDKFLNCSSKDESLFDCEQQTPPPGYNNTIASVTCSGRITVNLTNRCWGNVNVCSEGSCGGLCADAWTNTQSLKLCKDLDCGDKILPPNAMMSHKTIEVTFKSLHATRYTTNMSQCNLVKNDKKDNYCQKGSAYVVCSGSVKARISSTDKCSGNVELLYEGRWLPVCENALKDSYTQNTICEELGCGQADKIIPYLRPNTLTGSAISQIQCSQNDRTLKECIITSETTSCPLAGLQCSEWAKVKLSNTCSGAVFVYTNNSRSPVSAEGWTEKESNRLCEDVGCGKSKKISNISSTISFWNSTFSCANNPKNIWDCKDNTPPTHMQKLSIECEEKPSVTLSEKCNGIVKINGLEVCNTNWDPSYSQLVCQEQMCSNAIAGVAMLKDPKPDAVYNHVICEDFHFELGQCKRYKGKCGGKLVSVSCVKSVNFTTTHKCGGQVKVNYRDDKWENICPMNFSPELLKKLCHNLGCGDYNVSITHSSEPKQTITLETTLDCTEDNMDIKHCVRNMSCGQVNPATIYCNGFVPPPPPPPAPSAPTSIVMIILILGVVLIVVILIVIFVRVYLIKKARKAMKVPSRMLSQQEAEFESGEFEDIKDNEMEDFSRGNFRPEAEFISEKDARSNSSFPYDDIDEVAEAQPLTSQATAAGASGGNHNHEDQNGVTYEVDEPQENYDDIDASPEIAQTTAEVYDSPQPTPAVAPQNSVQADDYLVPGQDGYE